MSLNNNRTDLPVLILHNVDRTWTPAEVDDAVRRAVEIGSALRELGHPVTDVPVYDADLQTLLRDYDPDKYIVFNWCEALPGIPNSEALVAQILTELNFTKTGSPSTVLALSWNKPHVKRMLDQWCIPTPSWRVYESPEPNGWMWFPAIVKPAREHCSLGLTTASVVLTSGELIERIKYVLERFRQPALVEEFIDGREFSVTILGNSTPKTLPPAEMDYSAFEDVRERLCTFDSKFAPGSRHYEEIQVRLPVKLKEVEHERLTRIALAAYRMLCCRDYARIDIRLDKDLFNVLDINPNPDISPENSMAQAAELAGYSYGALISRLVNLAALRHPIFGRQMEVK